MMLNTLMKITAEKAGMMPVGMWEFEFDVVSGENPSVIGLHYWTGKRGLDREDMKHHHFKIYERNILLDKIAAKILYLIHFKKNIDIDGSYEK
jgi:hypothetical protein